MEWRNILLYAKRKWTGVLLFTVSRAREKQCIFKILPFWWYQLKIKAFSKNIQYYFTDWEIFPRRRVTTLQKYRDIPVSKILRCELTKWHGYGDKVGSPWSRSSIKSTITVYQDGVMILKGLFNYWPFVMAIYRSLVDFHLTGPVRRSCDHYAFVVGLNKRMIQIVGFCRLYEMR